MNKEEIAKIKEHIEIHARLEPRAIHITEIMRRAVVELEHIAELEQENAKLNLKIEALEGQIEKLIDFVLSKTECCDVCPITDTCINDEGTCPYTGILAKGEEEVTREWLMQFISKEIKEK